MKYTCLLLIFLILYNQTASVVTTTTTTASTTVTKANYPSWVEPLAFNGEIDPYISLALICVGGAVVLIVLIGLIWCCARKFCCKKEDPDQPVVRIQTTGGRVVVGSTEGAHVQSDPRNRHAPAPRGNRGDSRHEHYSTINSGRHSGHRSDQRRSADYVSDHRRGPSPSNYTSRKSSYDRRADPRDTRTEEEKRAENNKRRKSEQKITTTPPSAVKGYDSTPSHTKSKSKDSVKEVKGKDPKTKSAERQKQPKEKSHSKAKSTEAPKNELDSPVSDDPSKSEAKNKSLPMKTLPAEELKAEKSGNEYENFTPANEYENFTPTAKKTCSNKIVMVNTDAKKV